MKRALASSAVFWVSAVLVTAATANADHIDTLPPASEPHGMAAMYLCERLDESPTPATYNALVRELRAAGYTPAKVDKVVWFAMTYACPEYKQLADTGLLHQLPKVLHA